MKRSDINRIIREAVAFLEQMNWKLPPFAFYTLDDWKRTADDSEEIREAGLGWDVTDFGSGDYAVCGFVAFTIRNGKSGSRRYTKPYAEKIIIAGENQLTPYHFHWDKMEDIINRGGGNLLLELHNSTGDEDFATTPVEVSVDGRRVTLAAGGTVRLRPGESICLPPRLYHKFWAEEGHGKVLIGEVSKLNDDNVDNRFYEQRPRFTAIEEDEAREFLLSNEYDVIR